MKKWSFSLFSLFLSLFSQFGGAQHLRAETLATRAILQAHRNMQIPQVFFGEVASHLKDSAQALKQLPSGLGLANSAFEIVALPCDGNITSGFGLRRWGRRMKNHTGIDIAAPIGTPVRASASGTVIFSGRKGAYGNTIIVDHGQGLSTLYAHNSHLEVEMGQWVRSGDIVAHSGNSGRSTGPHVHYEIRVDSEPVNPMAGLPGARQLFARETSKRSSI